MKRFLRVVLIAAITLALAAASVGCSSTPAASKSPTQVASASAASGTPSEAPSKSAAATETPASEESEASAKTSDDTVASITDMTQEEDLAGMTYMVSPDWEAVSDADMPELPEGYQSAAYGVSSTDPAIGASISLQVHPKDVYEAAGVDEEALAEQLATFFGVVDTTVSEGNLNGTPCWTFTGTGVPLDGVDTEVRADGYVVAGGESYYFIILIGTTDSATQDLLSEFVKTIKVPS